jgi:hypothetical protein
MIISIKPLFNVDVASTHPSFGFKAPGSAEKSWTEWPTTHLLE